MTTHTGGIVSLVVPNPAHPKGANWTGIGQSTGPYIGRWLRV